ncbi:MAG TPA: 3-phosphoserine/phosphohydroxythreonine transaminase [Kofleriaceae bacterium]|nr:3-phosphoserine/phosphohydroxythreonine transaminase [Kofleriaceae bacterium]
MSDRIYNFSAGPAMLPGQVIRKSMSALWDLDGTGIGIMEHSHRGAAFQGVIDRAEALARELCGIPDSYSVLFLQGGASTQFFMVPMNLLGEGQCGDYVNTGAWSQKAMVEAKKLGKVHEAGSSEPDKFTYIPGPDQISWSEKPAYAHITSNNTIFGTEWHRDPEVPAGVPLVCDASSDIFSRPLDIKRYAMVYAGAQKNLGPAGVTLVIMRNDLAERAPKTLPTLLQYRTHIDKKSMFNTPPAFAIYVVGEVLAWLKEAGGLAAMAERNREKAALVYDYIDQSEMFSATARKDSRSLMNVCFRATSEDLEKKLIAQAGEAGLAGLKGHRSVGGMRASLYNAMPIEGCQALVNFLADFEKANR